MPNNTKEMGVEAQLLIDIGVEIDTHQDGDAFIKTFTFNEAQLEALASQIRAEREIIREEERERIRQNFKALCTVNNDGDCKYFKDELHNDLRDGAKFIAQHILDEILAPIPNQSELDQPKQ